MSTGVSVSNEVSATFEDFKLKKGEFTKCNFILYKLSDDKKTIVIDRVAGEGEGFSEFIGALPESSGRYGLVDVPVETDDGRETSKLVFIAWIPDTAKVREKMLYAGSKEYLKSQFDGVGVNINCSDMADLDYETVVKPTVLKFA